MAGYKAGEARILVLVQALTNFSADTATIGDWMVLKSGKSTKGAYAVLKPGSFADEPMTMTTYRFDWETIIEVWHQWYNQLSDAENLQALEDRVQEIIDGLQKYRKTGDTGDTVLHSEVSKGDLANEIFNKEGGLEWIMQEVTLEWSEEIAPAFAE